MGQAGLSDVDPLEQYLLDKNRIENITVDDIRGLTQNVFDQMDAEINTRDSAKGTYTSVSIKVTMQDPDAVVAKYLEVSKVEGVISL